MRIRTSRHRYSNWSKSTIISFNPSSNKSTNLHNPNSSDTNNKSHNFTTDRTWSNNLTCTKLASMKNKWISFNHGYKSRNSVMSKITNKSSKSCSHWNTICKLTKTLSKNFSKKITNCTKISTYRLMLCKNWNNNSIKLKEINKRLNINWDSRKVKGILIPLSWMKKILPKDNSNINSNNLWISSIMCLRKRGSGRRKISRLLMK